MGAAEGPPVAGRAHGAPRVGVGPRGRCGRLQGVFGRGPAAAVGPGVPPGIFLRAAGPKMAPVRAARQAALPSPGSGFSPEKKKKKGRLNTTSTVLSATCTSLCRAESPTLSLFYAGAEQASMMCAGAPRHALQPFACVFLR